MLILSNDSTKTTPLVNRWTLHFFVMWHTSKYININRNLDIFVTDIVILSMRNHIGQPESDLAQEETLPCIKWRMTIRTVLEISKWYRSAIQSPFQTFQLPLTVTVWQGSTRCYWRKVSIAASKYWIKSKSSSATSTTVWNVIHRVYVRTLIISYSLQLCLYFVCICIK